MRLFEMLESAGIACDCGEVRDFEVESLLPLHLADNRAVSYVDNDKYLPQVADSKAGAVLLAHRHKDKCANLKNAIFCENPHLAFALLSQFFKTPTLRNLESAESRGISAESRIFPSVFIGENVAIGKGCEIMPNVVLCDDVKIGENVKIYPGVVVYPRTIIGDNVIIHANSVIGSDGFGYAHTSDGRHIKIEHLGNVVIEDNAEIGACVAIDRAVFESTIIKTGAKIDNLVQIGHNCVIGAHSLLVAQVGFAGSTTTGRNVVCGGQAGTGGHLHIGDFTQVAGRGAVSKDLPPNTKWGGHPIMPLGEWQKMQVKLRKMTREK